MENEEYKYKLALLDKKMKLFERQLDKQKPVWIFHLIASGLCFVAVLGIAVYNYFFQGHSLQLFASMCLPSGSLIYCLGQIMKTWTDATRIIENFQ